MQLALIASLLLSVRAAAAEQDSRLRGLQRRRELFLTEDNTASVEPGRCWSTTIRAFGFASFQVVSDDADFQLRYSMDPDDAGIVSLVRDCTLEGDTITCEELVNSFLDDTGFLSASVQAGEVLFVDVTSFGLVSSVDFRFFLDADSTSQLENCEQVDMEASPSLYLPVALQFSGECFAASSTVTLASGAQVALADVQVGDEILTLAEETGHIEPSPVIAIPHRTTSAMSSQLRKATTVSGIELRATPAHLVYAVQDCGKATSSVAEASMLQMRGLKPGMCLVGLAEDGSLGLQPIVSVEAIAESTSVLSVVTLNAGLPMVDGVAASSFAYFHALPTMYYAGHRVAYFMNAQWLLRSSMLDLFGTVAGAAAVQAAAFLNLLQPSRES